VVPNRSTMTASRHAPSDRTHRTVSVPPRPKPVWRAFALERDIQAMSGSRSYENMSLTDPHRGDDPAKERLGSSDKSLSPTPQHRATRDVGHPATKCCHPDTGTLAPTRRYLEMVKTTRRPAPGDGWCCHPPTCFDDRFGDHRSAARTSTPGRTQWLQYAPHAAGSGAETPSPWPSSQSPERPTQSVASLIHPLAVGRSKLDATSPIERTPSARRPRVANQMPSRHALRGRTRTSTRAQSRRGRPSPPPTLQRCCHLQGTGVGPRRPLPHRCCHRIGTRTLSPKLRSFGSSR
jgi:hypothetical protein